MQIKKINDNQIRCTLTKEDLIARQLKISELAYGSEKVKELFVEICKRAFIECNFVADGTPLVIEAIPLSSESLVLVMTKVDDPEELDSRFSSFTAEPDETDPVLSNEERVYADEVIGCMEHLNKLLGDPLASKLFSGEDGNSAPEIPIKTLSKIYSFDSLDEVIRLSKVIKGIYHGENTLYKDKENNRYYLMIFMTGHTPEQFNRICNIISEYVSSEHPGPFDLEYFREHFETIVKDKAVQVLAKF